MTSSIEIPDYLLPLSAADRHAIDEGCWFDLQAAERVRKFCRDFLRHSKGQWADQPFELLKWQWEHVIAPLFGWKRANGTRRFRRAYIEIPKKNGKSTLLAAIALYLLTKDHEPGAEVYSAACSREQASIIYKELESMIVKSPALARRLKCCPSIKRVNYDGERAWFQSLSADAPTKEGLNASAVIVDELHAHKTRTLFETLEYAGRARRQPLYVVITTAGLDRESICYEQHQYAERIIAGTHFDSSFFGYIQAADPEDNWTAPATWYKANPSLGITIAEETFAEECRAAQGNPLRESSFKRYSLNLWVNQETQWIQLDKWQACDKPLGDLDGRVCYAGLDLASTTDLCALSLVFPWADGSVSVRPYYWCPHDAFKERERRNRTRLDKWAAEGWIKKTPGAVVDYDHVRKDILDLRRQFNIKELRVDPWNAVQLATQLIGDGFKVELFRQGYASFSGPMKELEKLILAGQLRHGDNPVLTWNFANLAVDQDPAGNIKPAKDKAADKIDGLVATVMALAGCVIRTRHKSVYEERGIEVL